MLAAILCYSLRTFLDLDYLVRYEPVSLPMDGFRCFFIGSFGKAEDLARLLVVPVPVILDPWSIKSGIAPILLSPAFPSGLFTLGLYPVARYKGRFVTKPIG